MRHSLCLYASSPQISKAIHLGAALLAGLSLWSQPALAPAQTTKGNNTTHSPTPKSGILAHKVPQSASAKAELERLWKEGQAADDKANYGMAERLWSEGLRRSQTDKVSLFLVRFLNGLGSLYEQQKQHAKAIECYSKALPLQEKLSDKTALARTLNNLAIAYNESNASDKAIPHLKQALAIAELIPDKTVMADTLCYLGTAYSNKKEADSAIRYFQRAIALEESLKRSYDLAFNLHELADVYRSKKEYDKRNWITMPRPARRFVTWVSPSTTKGITSKRSTIIPSPVWYRRSWKTKRIWPRP
jgi:tetratricopeptide (TPR) repeat protein